MHRLGQTLRPLWVVLALMALVLTSVQPMSAAAVPDAPSATQADTGQAPRLPAEQGEIRDSAYYSNCGNVLIDQDWVGYSDATVSGWLATGARATISNRFKVHECTDTTGTDLNAGASAWVAVVGSNSNEIIQVGYIDCNDPGEPTSSACHDNYDSDEPVYFWAAGRNGGEAGCPSTLEPWPHYAGDPGGETEAEFIVLYTKPSHTIQFWADGVMLEEIDSTPFECWLDEGWSYSHGQFLGERWDGNDGVGESGSGNKVLFDGSRMGYYTHGWNDPGFVTGGGTDANCLRTVSEFHCSVLSSDSVQVWTIQ